MASIVTRSPARRRLSVTLAIAFVILNLVDILVTLYVLKGQGGTELNPIMSFFLQQPTYVSVAIKVFGSALVALLLLDMRSKWEQQVTSILFALVIGISLVCLFNLVGVLATWL